MTDKLYVRGITRTYSDRPASGGPAVALATSPSWPHIETTNAAERVTHIRPPATITTDAEGRWSVELVHAEGVQYLITCDWVKRLLDLDAVNTLGQPLYPVGAQVEWAALPSDFVTPPPPINPGGVTDHGALTGLDDDDHSAVYVRFTIGASGPAVPRAGDFWMVTP